MTAYVLASTIYDNNAIFLWPYDPRCPTTLIAGIQYYEPSFLIVLYKISTLLFFPLTLGKDSTVFKTLNNPLGSKGFPVLTVA